MVTEEQQDRRARAYRPTSGSRSSSTTRRTQCIPRRTRARHRRQRCRLRSAKSKRAEQRAGDLRASRCLPLGRNRREAKFRILAAVREGRDRARPVDTRGDERTAPARRTEAREGAARARRSDAEQPRCAAASGVGRCNASASLRVVGDHRAFSCRGIAGQGRAGIVGRSAILPQELVALAAQAVDTNVAGRAPGVDARLARLRRPDAAVVGVADQAAPAEPRERAAFLVQGRRRIDAIAATPGVDVPVAGSAGALGTGVAARARRQSAACLAEGAGENLVHVERAASRRRFCREPL